MRYVLLLTLALAGCGSANRTDGVTPSEAAGLNAAADKLDNPPTDQPASKAR